MCRARQREGGSAPYRTAVVFFCADITPIRSKTDSANAAFCVPIVVGVNGQGSDDTITGAKIAKLQVDRHFLRFSDDSAPGPGISGSKNAPNSLERVQPMRHCNCRTKLLMQTVFAPGI
jgi:hypothetical protein